VFIGVRTPYDLMAFPQAPTFLVTYCNTPVVMEALVEVLYGRMQPQGRLPVELPGLHATRRLLIAEGLPTEAVPGQ